VLLVFGAPCQLLSPAGLEHGRTIPLPDMSTAHQSSSIPEEFTVKEGGPRGITFSFDFEMRGGSGGAEHY
jgi:hypothetical protein